MNAVLLVAIVTHTVPLSGYADGRLLNRAGVRDTEKQSGGYSGGVPPLPIPNREVKPAIADGTAMQCGRVGSRLLFERASESERKLRLSFFDHYFTKSGKCL